MEGISHARVATVAAQFAIEEPIAVEEFPGRGNINQDTYLVVSGLGASRQEYILQRINEKVFTRPRNVMAAMVACIAAQREALPHRALAPEDRWEPVTLVPTRSGEWFWDEGGLGRDVWRLMARIGGCVSYKSLNEVPDEAKRLALAEEAARGLALFGDLTAGMDTASLENPLPGYRDTEIYINQLQSVLSGNRTLEQARALLPQDPILLQSVERHFLVHLSQEDYAARLADPELAPFLEVARRHAAFGRSLLDALRAGHVRRVAIHGDTKLENFLFDSATGRVRALVDLDTIMPHTWLADWGDMVRSLVNVAGEKEPDLHRVQVDLPVYEALLKGFLSTARAVTEAEVARMADAVEVIAWELGIRFLADYLRGDTYFQPSPEDPWDINRTRAMVQLSLFQKLRQYRPEIQQLMKAFRP
ncbi:MAG: phosphotransferase [Chthonomonadales bacterium]